MYGSGRTASGVESAGGGGVEGTISAAAAAVVDERYNILLWLAESGEREASPAAA